MGGCPNALAAAWSMCANTSCTMMISPSQYGCTRQTQRHGILRDPPRRVCPWRDVCVPNDRIRLCLYVQSRLLNDEKLYPPSTAGRDHDDALLVQHVCDCAHPLWRTLHPMYPRSLWRHVCNATTRSTSAPSNTAATPPALLHRTRLLGCAPTPASCHPNPSATVAAR